MRVVIFAVFLSIMQTAPPVPRQAPNNSNQGADSGKQKATQHPNPVATTAPSQEVPKKAVGEQATAKQPATPNAEQPIRISELPTVSVTRDWIDITGWIFSGILVGVGIGGICAAYRTLRVIARQTASIERQTELQSAQWVALKNWRGELSGPFLLTIKVDVVNETNFPLTLTGTDFRVGTAIFAGTEQVTIIPREKHGVGFVHRMTQEESWAYLDKITVFGVRGAIRYTGVSGKQVQPFGGLIAASRNGISFESRSEYEQSAKEHYGDKEPPN